MAIKTTQLSIEIKAERVNDVLEQQLEGLASKDQAVLLQYFIDRCSERVKLLQRKEKK